MDFVTLIAINFSRNTYYDIYGIGSNVNMFLQIIIFLSIMFTASGRGLHDIIAGTKVINTKVINEEKNEVNETKENNIKEEIIKPNKKTKNNKKKEDSENE